jgi:hypothetical protein
MSYKKRLEAHYYNLIDSVRTITLPSWLFSRAIRTSLFCLVVILSVAYVLRINNASAIGYQAHYLEKDVDALAKEVQRLNIQIADAGSITSLENKIGALGMVKADSVQYISNTEMASAR